MTEPARPSDHILVVDDDPRIRQMLMRYFEGEGYRVTAVADGTAMRRVLQQAPVSIILLDLVLPGSEDGLSLAREIRANSNVPIIMLTGRDDVVDRIVGLEIGADDYIAKPFHLREVLARLRTVLRRQAPVSAVAEPSRDVLEFDGYSLDLGRRRLLAASGSEIVLTTGEFDILAVLVGQPGHVFSRETLMDRTRGRTLEAFDRTIDAQIARLRKKIEPDSKQPALIKSVRGVGYVFTGRLQGSV
jgi:DNA-binding response OmpR family regulator